MIEHEPCSKSWPDNLVKLYSKFNTSFTYTNLIRVTTYDKDYIVQYNCV